MKKVTLSVIMLLFCAFIVISCKKNEDTTPPDNQQPTTPASPNPADASANVSTTPVLNWTCSDPDAGDGLEFDIYFGSVNPPNTLLVSNWKQSNYTLSALDFNKTYYWRVTAHDSQGASAVGPIWRFTTLAELPPQGLLAYYPFNGNANDGSGNGHNGTVNGATLTGDRFGNQNAAYSFNGVNTFIEILNSSNLNLKPGGFTLLAWVNFTDYNTNGVVVAKHQFTYGTGYGLAAVENHALFFLDGGGANGIRTTESYDDGNWHLFVAAYNEISMLLYVDGSLKISQPTDYDQTNSSNICIGNSVMYGGGYAGYFKGKIDDVRIYSRTLTESEIMQFYHESGWPK